MKIFNKRELFELWEEIHIPFYGSLLAIICLPLYIYYSSLRGDLSLFEDSLIFLSGFGLLIGSIFFLFFVFQIIVFVVCSIQESLEKIKLHRYYKMQKKEQQNKINIWEKNHPNLLFCNKCNGTGIVKYEKIVREVEEYQGVGRTLFIDFYLGPVCENDSCNEIVKRYEYETLERKCEDCDGLGGIIKIVTQGNGVQHQKIKSARMSR